MNLKLQKIDKTIQLLNDFVRVTLTGIDTTKVQELQNGSSVTSCDSNVIVFLSKESGRGRFFSIPVLMTCHTVISARTPVLSKFNNINASVLLSVKVARLPTP